MTMTMSWDCIFDLSTYCIQKPSASGATTTKKGTRGKLINIFKKEDEID